MELIKRKILLENNIDRTNGSPNWGTLTATTFYINVFITQNVDDMGLFTDIDYIPSSTATTYPISAITSTDLVTLRLQDTDETNYYNYINKVITGKTDTKIEDLMSYDMLDRYKVGFNIDTEGYLDYVNQLINGVSRITSLGEPNIYVFDANNDPLIGTINQTTGILYEDYSAQTNTFLLNGSFVSQPLTTFRYIGQGLNETNVSLSALTKEEYLFGIISPPEVKSDVFIDRSVMSIMDAHLRLSEIKNLGELTRYGNGYYNITRI
jgi:hypothetical protein